LIEFGKELIAGISGLQRRCHSRWRSEGSDNRNK
jgi:hypothetical protein